MKLPEGRQVGVDIDPQKGDVVQYLKSFRGVFEINANRGKGFLLIHDGKLVAGIFEDKEGVYLGGAAVRYIMDTAASRESQIGKNFVMRTYNEDEYAEALEMCTNEGLLIGTIPMVKDVSPHPPTNQGVSSVRISPRVDESTLNKLMCQPGVVAVSAFYEGFPVLSLGEADFEHVAARAEDFMRTGTKIAQDMNLGQTEQLILETAEKKFIIVPCGDLFLCIITRADAQLGLMRVLIRSIQNIVGIDT